MGCSHTKTLRAPTNPLEELQYEEAQKEIRRRKREKEQKRIAKLQKKHAKKKSKSKKAKCSERHSKRKSDVESCNNSKTDNQNLSNTDINSAEILELIEQRTRKQLDNDLCKFILNQIALSQQFLGNFDSEISKILEEFLQKENDYNQKLEEQSILLGNLLDAAVAKWVKYKPLHGPHKAELQSIQTPTMYVIFENIDIASPQDVNYDSISPLCKVQLETDSYKTTPFKEDYTKLLSDVKWKGYVRLKLRDNAKPSLVESKTHRTSSNDVYMDIGSNYSMVGGYSMKPNGKMVACSSGYSSESDTDYAYICHLNTHHPLTELRISNSNSIRDLNPKVLPESCISTLRDFIRAAPGNFDDDDDEEHDDDSDNEFDSCNDEETNSYDQVQLNDDSDVSFKKGKNLETLKAVKLYRLEAERRHRLLQQTYLNSKEFMHYFGELLRQKLLKTLSIDDDELRSITYRGASVYTKAFEIIPAIHVAHNVQNWPDCAFQFRIRQRPVTTNPRTGREFQWPTRPMIKRIESFGYHVIPMGYAPKHQRNPFKEIEWRIVFPKAERFLEQHLSSTQVKVFMMTKALLKTFINPQESSVSLAFALDSIRNHLFWECERDYAAWPEEFLGDVLMRFISRFMIRLREKCLRDYFIEERNHFEGIPEYSLMSLYSLLSDIVLNPLMHLMVALRNLNLNETFFPKLNFKKIFSNLSENDMVKLRGMSKNSRNLQSLVADDKPTDSVLVDEGARGLVGMKQHRERTTGRLRRKTHLMRHHIELKRQQVLLSKCSSTESIDIEFFFNTAQSNQGLENLRRTNILECLLDHLILVLKKSIKLDDFHLSRIYLNHAKLLCKYYSAYGCDVNAKGYMKTIESIANAIDQEQKRKSSFSFIAPALPARGSVDISSVIAKCDETSSNEYARTSSSDEANTDVEESVDIHKSIKFYDVVVEVQEGDINPIQKPEGYSPVGILRHTNNSDAMLEIKIQSSPENSDAEENDFEVTVRSSDAEFKVSVEDLTELREEESKDNDDKKVCDIEKSETIKLEAVGLETQSLSFAHTLKASANHLKNLPIVDANVFQQLITSSGKLMEIVNDDEKRSKIHEKFRKKSLRLKGVFNQSSDS